MAGGKNTTQRIETLESQAAQFATRLEVHDTLINRLNQVLEKTDEATQGHHAKILVIEQQLLVLVELKSAMSAFASIEKELVAVKKDLETLHKWREELKKEKEEATRRWWSFGPNITAALISGVITLLGIALNYWLSKPR
jgi:hypothetical protein